MLKQREQKILDYMKSEIKTKGYPPTVREICTALHIKSTSTAHKDIESLVRQGYLVKDPSKPRALMVVDPQEAADIPVRLFAERAALHAVRFGLFRLVEQIGQRFFGFGCR